MQISKIHQVIKNVFAKLKNKCKLIGCFVGGTIVLVLVLVIYRYIFSAKTNQQVSANTPTPNIVNQSFQPKGIVEDIFVKQEKGTETKRTFINPFGDALETPSRSNLSQSVVESQKYKTLLESVEKEGKLFDQVYLKENNSNYKKVIFTIQEIFYPYEGYDPNTNLDPISEADALKDIGNIPGSAQKVYSHVVSPDDKYAIITTDEEIYIYNIPSSSLVKVFDQNTPEDVYQVVTKFKRGYDYCYVSPFVFTPDRKKVLVHKCLYEGMGLMEVNLETNKVKDLSVPLGFGNNLFEYGDDYMLYYDRLINDDQPGLFVLDTKDMHEKRIASLEGMVVSAATIEGNIYFVNENEVEGWLDLYKYIAAENKLEKLAHSENRTLWSDLYPKIYIWQDGNRINWDLVTKDEEIYRFESSI